MKPVCKICNSWMNRISYYSIYLKCCACGFTRKDEKSMAEINWSDPESQISEHFTVHEALFLPTWGRLATEADGLTDEIKNNLVNLCFIMEKVRILIGFPINVHCMYRPSTYSKLVGGSLTDVHTQGMAIDYDCNPNLSCDQVKAILIPQLKALNIRMENNGSGALWIHNDIHSVGNARYFLA